MDGNLKGKGGKNMIQDQVLFITGAARGIGFDIAKAFSEAGAKVVISDLTQQAIDEALSQFGKNVEGIVCDVTERRRH